MTRFVLAIALLLSSASATAQAPSARSLSAPPPPTPMEMRPIDRAAVRIVGLFAITARTFDSETTRVRRLAASGNWGHGTGFFVDATGLVATARHVVEGADLIAVFVAGSDVPHPATVVYADPDHDVAFLHVSTDVPAFITVPPSPRRLAIADPITGTGFPLDARQRLPAAFVGVVAREVNGGGLQTSTPVNPGNSGGPVVDSHGELVGLVSMGANVRAGAQGLAWLEPTRVILPGLQIARHNLTLATPQHSEADGIAAQILADFLGTNDDVPLYERTSFDLVQRAAATSPTPHTAMLLAAHAWNVHIALLEEREANDLPALPADEQANAARLRAISMAMARRALDQAPHLRISYSVGLSILAQLDRSIVIREGGR